MIFQAAPVFLPSIGLLFSPLSTLPVAIAAVYQISLGITVYFSAFFILLFIYGEEAIILLFTTGLLGVIVGSLLLRKNMIVSILFSSIILSIGMLVLTFLLEIPVFGENTNSISVLLVYLFFPLIYATLWNYFLSKLFRFIMKRNLIGINIS